MKSGKYSHSSHICKNHSQNSIRLSG